MSMLSARLATRVRRRHSSGVRCESLEPRRLLADLRFAVIGDFSVDQQTQPEQAVSNLVKSWNPSFVVTVGDNNYPNGAASTIDANIGQFYHQYIYPYKGSYGAGSADGQNHFWPALGNHDWNTTGAQPYLNYFTLPGNERYYDFTQGNVEFFIVDSEPQEPDGTSSTSVQGQWLKTQLAQSTAQWKLVVFHHPAYSSGVGGDNSYMQWPFQQWGATAIFEGHDHDYERLTENGLPYFVDGLGGESITGFNSPDSGSQVRYSSDDGAMLMDASSTSINFQFIARTGTVIDSYTIGTATAPTAPSSLTAAAVSASQINLTWADNSSNETGFKIDRSTDGVNFSPLTTVASNSTSYSDTGLSANTTYYYRVRATNSGGDSSNSNVASAATLQAGAGVTYLSSLQWVSATVGYGTIQKDLSIKGNPITLRGTVYPKGIGTHAVSQIVYNLNKQYSSFVSDVGVDDEVSATGSVDFQVLGDGKVLFDSGVVTNKSAVVHINISVVGVQQLTLIANNGVAGSIDYDHADWAGAELIVNTPPTVPAAPTGLTAVAVALAQVNLAWVHNLANETGFKIERSTDGVNFAQIATAAANLSTYSDATTVANTTYYYRVRATNSVGDSGYSNVATAPPVVAPATPINLVANIASATQIDLAWAGGSNNADGFNIERSIDGVNFTQIYSADDTQLSYPDIGLASGTQYYYRIYAINAAGNSPYSSVATVTTPAATVATNLTDLTWASATTGWGTVGVNLSVGGNPIALRGVTYAKGIGVNAVSQIVYNVGGKYANFIADLGVDDEEKGYGTVDFQVLGDGKLLYDSGNLTGYSPVDHADVPIIGVQQLTLVANNGVAGSINFDHADWAGAQLLAILTPPAAPSSLTATPVSATQINLAWSSTSTNVQSFSIERSTDGTNFSVIGSANATASTYSDSTVSVNTTYYYRVRALNAAGPSPYSSVASAKTSNATVTTYLSDLTWASATVGYGTIQKDHSIKGNPITLRGTVYPKGIGTHAVSQIVYNLNGQYTSFISDVGVDDEVSSTGSVDFQVIGDGKVLFDSGVVTNKSAVVHINISVVGVKQLTLVATNGVSGSIDYDHADWAGARLLS